MNQPLPSYRLPDYRRKGNRAPRTEAGDLNQWALGQARALKLVASLDRAGHQTVIAQLRMILKLTILTEAQFDEVNKEIEARRELVNDASRVISNCQSRIDQQYDKLPETLPDPERIQSIVGGPARPVDVATLSVVAKSRITAPQFRHPNEDQTLRRSRGQTKPKAKNKGNTKVDVPATDFALSAAWFPRAGGNDGQ